ncbi:MAG: SRPBCC family protein, partial [Gemmatimonadota bacterium]
MTTDNPVSARVSRAYSASPERVFDAWLDPEKVRVWWTLSAAAAGRGASETVDRVQIEPHLGGSFSILVRRDGTVIDHTGTYLELERPRRLVFTWS